jgi:hypothetical protein
MRAGFFTILAVVTAACSQIPVQKRDVGGDIVHTKAADFAVFAREGHAVAIRMGSQGWGANVSPAVDAIRRATGCDIVLGSVTLDPKSLSAEILCPDPTVAFAPQQPDL